MLDDYVVHMVEGFAGLVGAVLVGLRQISKRSSWRVDTRLPGKGNSKSRDTRPVHQIVSLFLTNAGRLGGAYGGRLCRAGGRRSRRAPQNL